MPLNKIYDREYERLRELYPLTLELIRVAGQSN